MFSMTGITKFHLPFGFGNFTGLCTLMILIASLMRFVVIMAFNRYIVIKELALPEFCFD
ncbi:hypothetical protein GS458_3108 [Geobacillus stearothermophilus]|nr:hypothetical protein GS458_3108 [Geobacillus stearothermophilus]